MLARRGALKGVEVNRITFNEITKRAIQHAVAHPRDLDTPLIEAYLARRALDYLVGFNLSPVLWRKLPGSKSAGRVQSVALRLICEREAEIEAFRRANTGRSSPLRDPGRRPLHRPPDPPRGPQARAVRPAERGGASGREARGRGGRFSVHASRSGAAGATRPPPFTTSTLQMEASRKLGMGAQAAMRVAQQLYEGVDIGGETVGLITYMRTDGVQMAREAIFAIRDHVKESFGPDYVPGAPREYASKAKNAQEAHEAIRPTDVAARRSRWPASSMTASASSTSWSGSAPSRPRCSRPSSTRRRSRSPTRPAAPGCAPTAPSSPSTAS
jgi:DNA topoisomerase-1